jgi:hypothetical protein
VCLNVIECMCVHTYVSMSCNVTHVYVYCVITMCVILSTAL